MNYTILIQRPAEKFIAKLPRPDKERVLRAIAKLPGEGDRKAMQGHPGLYRLRVGELPHPLHGGQWKAGCLRHKRRQPGRRVQGVLRPLLGPVFLRTIYAQSSKNAQNTGAHQKRSKR